MRCACCGQRLSRLEIKYAQPEYRRYMGTIINKTVVEKGPLCIICETLLVDLFYGDTVDGNCDPNWTAECGAT